MSGTFRTSGRDLIGKGYLVVPIQPNEKRPKAGLTEWQNLRLGVGDLARYAECGTGIMTAVGANPIVAIDIDVLYAPLVDEFVAWCLANLGPAPARVGMAPKTLLVYRASEPGWTKAHSDVFSDMFDDRHQLEVLGRGNQFVAYHVHPDTERPYKWMQEPPNASTLTTITIEQVVAAVRVFSEMALRHGLTVRSSQPDGSVGSAPAVPKERTPRADDDFFGRVNDAAMTIDAMDRWVPALLPNAKRYKNGYRVAQVDLGRADLQEDLSIIPYLNDKEPYGIKDWGVHDTGDARRGGRTPIDLVLEWAHLTMDVLSLVGMTAFDAAMWLCKQMGTPREELGYGARRTAEKNAELDSLRETLEGVKAKLASSVDMIAVRAEALPMVRDAVQRFSVLHGELYDVYFARAKALGASITRGEFAKLVAPVRVPTVKSKKPLTEFGNADRMLESNRDRLMYTPETDCWYVWNDIHWISAIGGSVEIEHLAKETIKELHNEVDLHRKSEEDLSEFYDFCKLSQRAQMVTNVVKLARVDPRVVVPAGELDKHHYYLGVANGIVDLRTGALLPPDPKLRITLSTNCDYVQNARAPVFEQTIKDVFSDDLEMVEYVMRVFGYALMGNPIEDIMFFPFGSGANGKSTIFNAIRLAMGGYARTAEASSFVSDDGGANNAGGAREDLVRLRGARFVYVNEPDEGSELREGTVKSMTGGDEISARGMYAKNSIEIKPTWVVFMPTNHKPIIKGSDNGIWRRMGMIPFERNFENDPLIKNDKNRKMKLQTETTGILSLMVQAALRYQRDGLTPPKKVRAARDEYRNQMDLLAEWLEECCEIASDFVCETGHLWESWEGFAKRRGLISYIRSSAALGRRLDQRFPSCRLSGGIRGRSGIRLKPIFSDLFK